MQPVAEILDKQNDNNNYVNALKVQKEVAKDPDRTPSAIILNEMRNNGESFFPFTMRYSKSHSRHFQNISLSDELRRFFKDHATTSIQKQANIEASNGESFDEFLQNYFAQA